jgi:hypothetical protein
VIVAQVSEPWITPGGAAILSACVLIIGGLITAIVELRKTRVSQRNVEHEVRPNTGGSMRDAVDKGNAASVELGGKLDRVIEQLHEVDKRLTRVETRTEYLVPRHRGNDGK